MDKTLIAIIGPTAIGKTTLAIKIASHFKTEVLSADSRQFYKEMQIGTAVPTTEELNAIPHHFIQHKSIFEPYSVGDFERDALTKLDALFKTRQTVVMVGGSGMYVDAVVNGLDNFPEVDQTIREKLIHEKETFGLEHLQNQLLLADPVHYQRVDLSNPHRVIRALEICLGTGKPYSSFLAKNRVKRPFKTIYIGLSAERPIIYERINIRVDNMMTAGLLKEAEQLLPHKELNALQTVGYRELFQFMEGAWSLETAIDEIKKNTRRFAKRQLTWYRKNTAVKWFGFQSDIQPILDYIKEEL
ncbi:tRNA (adenosine(37)-N6)-dimethylallyltransferase MiaA [uncultured Croceitalea sp.]|uniref:tRNA (adenosine(37)-N6)-dimethylallyltransferase MiaA n=1 Tax=uncultured Croceitalea sp. TaxID=1798908 RepID=UPI00330611B4